eukprot:scaffold13214_cov77-Phaeocystis_antarctica.AAC.2
MKTYATFNETQKRSFDLQRAAGGRGAHWRTKPPLTKRKRTQGIDATRRPGGHKQESKGSTEGDRPPVGWARWAAPLRDFHDTSEEVREGSYGRRA